MLTVLFMQMVHIHVPTNLHKMQRTLDTEEKESLDSLAEEKQNYGVSVYCTDPRGVKVAPTTSQMLVWLHNSPPCQAINPHLEISFSSKNISSWWIVSKGGSFLLFTEKFIQLLFSCLEFIHQRALDLFKSLFSSSPVSHLPRSCQTPCCVNPKPNHNPNSVSMTLMKIQIPNIQINPNSHSTIDTNISIDIWE